MNASFTRLIETARLARRWAMRNRSKFNCDEDLAGMCAIASGYLHRLLNKSGFVGLADFRKFAALCTGHCSTCVALPIRAMMT